MTTSRISLQTDEFCEPELLFEGRSTRVCRARRVADGTSVVLKVLPGPFPSAERVAALQQEAEHARLAAGPNVIHCSGMIELGDTVGLVLEDIDGVSLDRLLERGPLSCPTALQLGEALAVALERTHERKVIHRDVNPSNVIWNASTGELRLIDFGIATSLARQQPGSPTPRDIEGTLAYVSPEQTGRTSRLVDSRTDLYSLGATLYHLLVRHPPFPAGDLLELMHAHLAIQPSFPPSASVPDTVERLVLKLLSKDPADRYQTARGVRRDLARCREELARFGHIDAFALGQSDHREELVFRQKLYGRDRELSALREAHARISRGGVEVVVVSGYSGIGKTSLVRELAAPVLQSRGHFVSGKFDQYRRDQPYAALLEALRQLVHQVLAEPDDALKRWRDRVGAAMGETGQAVIDVLPELETLVGPQPPLSDLPPTEAEARFHMAMRRLVSSLGDRSAPLVLFLDDLQWADVPTLGLLEGLCRGQAAEPHLLLVCAYRSNEVDAGHPAILSLKAIEGLGTRMTRLQLARLSTASVREMLADALRIEPDEVHDLADVCISKTHGNPFYLIQFLTGLGEAGAVRFDANASRWTWDLERIRQETLTENVVDYLSRRIERLAPEQLEVLQRASVLGGTFEADDLMGWSDETSVTRATVEEALTRSVELGFLLATGTSRQARGTAAAVRAPRLAFAHDGIRQAVYAGLPEPRRQHLHLTLGRHLRDGLEGDAQAAFQAVDHLNRARPLIDDPAERVRLARLDLEVGSVALRSAAPRQALDLLEAGLSCAGERVWQEHYDLAFPLYQRAAEAALLSGEIERMQALCEAIAHSAATALDRTAAFDVRMAQRKAENDLGGAVDTAIEALRLLHVELPQTTTTPFILGELLQTKWRLRGWSMDRLETHQTMQDETIQKAARLLADLMPAAYYARPDLLPFIVFRLIRITLSHGVAPASSYAFVVYALLLCSLGQLRQGYEFGKLAQRLAHRVGDLRFSNIANHIFQAHVRFWWEPLRDCVDEERTVHRVGVEVGDPEYAAFGALMHCNLSAFAGEPLPEVLQRHEDYGAAITSLAQKTPSYHWGLSMQQVMNLSGRTDDRVRLRGPAYDEAQRLPVHEAANDATTLFVYHATKVTLCAFFNEPTLGLEHVEGLRIHKGGAGSSITTWVSEYYAALVELVALGDPNRHGTERGRLERSAKKRIQRINRWAACCEANFAHQAALLNAEWQGLSGDYFGALQEFDRAIQLAQKQGVTNDEAIACERAARFLFRHGHTTSARAYLARARYAYERWGAKAKLAQLAEEFSGQVNDAPSASVAGRDERTTRASRAEVDLTAVLQAGQAISESLVLAELLEKLLRLVIEAAGAQRGALVLVGDEGPRVQATIDDDGASTVKQGLVLADAQHLSPQVVSYVLRAQRPLVLDDAADDPVYASERYFRRHQVRSVLCAPLIHQGETRGAIYLENDLAVGSFTEESTEIVALLSSQAAISIENAALYSDLEDKVRHRTAQLELRNRFIQETFGRYLSDAVVEGLLHQPEGLALGGEKRVVTIMMTDLRGFTAKCAVLAPERVVQLINVYLSAMTEIIMRYAGTIDEFIGDAILVVFGAPIVAEDDAERAVACALEMQLAMPEVNAKTQALGLPAISMGIGINTGEVVVGNIGSERRAKYGVVGSTVNVAARIESYTSGDDIFVSQSTLDRIASEPELDTRVLVAAKGVSEPVVAHSVLGLKGRYDLHLPRRDSQRTRLSQSIPVTYQRIEDKLLLPEKHSAELVELAPDHAVLKTPTPEPAFSDLELFVPHAGGVANLYAKVAAVGTGDAMQIRFTSVPEPARQALDQHARVDKET